MWLAALVCIVASFRLAWSQSQTKELSINLKARALVIGPRILLHEICVIDSDDRKIREQLGTVQLGQAPPPGESKELTLSFIKLQIRRAGLQQYLGKVSGPKVVRVTTAHEEISKAVLEDAVTDFVRSRLPASGLDFRIELHRVPAKLWVPQTSYRLELESSGKFVGRGYQVFRLNIIVQGEKIASLPLSGTIRVFQEVAIAKARMSRHQEINEQAVEFAYRDITHLSAAPVTRATFIPGRRSKVIIEPGQILEAAMLEVTPLVERGRLVRLVVAAGNVEIVTAGRAQDSGHLADAVRVRHLPYGKILRGQVAGVDVVRVVL